MAFYMSNKNHSKTSEILEAMRKNTFITRRNLIFLAYFSNIAKAESVLVSVAIDYEGVRKTHKKDKGIAEKPNAFLV